MDGQFNNRGPFRVGEVVVIVGSDTQPQFNGCEAIILHVYGNGMYSIDVSHPLGGWWAARENRLRRRRPPTTGEEAIRAMFDSPVSDVFLVNPDLASFASQDALANDVFNNLSVRLENSLQIAEIAGWRFKQILNGFILDEASLLHSVDLYRKGNAPVLSVDNRNGWKFDVHAVPVLQKRMILA